MMKGPEPRYPVEFTLAEIEALIEACDHYRLCHNFPKLPQNMLNARTRLVQAEATILRNNKEMDK